MHTHPGTPVQAYVHTYIHANAYTNTCTYILHVETYVNAFVVQLTLEQRGGYGCQPLAPPKTRI